jgi:hypothetical protein
MSVKRDVAVGAASVLIAAQCVADTGDGAAAQPGRCVQVYGVFIRGHFERHQAGTEAQTPGQRDEVPAGVDLAGQDLGLLVVGQLEQVVGQRDAPAAGPLVDEETGPGGLAAAADVEGVDDVRVDEAGQLSLANVLAVAGAAESRPGVLPHPAADDPGERPVPSLETPC